LINYFILLKTDINVSYYILYIKYEKLFVFGHCLGFENIIVYPWDYQAVTVLEASKGMQVEISLEHDTTFSGHATATFYCLEYDE